MDPSASPTLRLAVFSDTHGHVLNTLSAVRMLASFNIDRGLHCGDIGSPQIPALLPWPTDFVLGNVDYDADELRRAVEAAGHAFHGRFAELTLAGRKIAALHSDDGQRFHATVTSGQYDLVCYGHTHLAEQHFVRDTLVLNPGALYRAREHTVAILELPRLDAQFVRV